MPRHVEAWMDGVALSSIDAVMIRQIHEDPPQLEIVTGERPGRYGERLISTTRKSIRVVIEVVIRELFDLGKRTRIQERLAAWTMGSVLELSNHPGRRLRVTCSAQPTLGDVRDYTQSLRMEFTAHAVPYWEDAGRTQLTLNGSKNSGKLFIPGTVRTPVSLSIRPTGGKLTAFTATVEGMSIALNGLSVAQDEELRFERDVRDDLAIVQGGASRLSRRSAESADDLLASPGRAAVGFAANTQCTVTFSVRGRWA